MLKIPEIINGKNLNSELRLITGKYYISEHLNVYKLEKNGYRSMKVDPSNFKVKLTVDKKPVIEKVTILGAKCFLQPEKNKPYVHFRDENPENKHVSNLMYSENEIQIINQYTIKENVLLDGNIVEKEVKVKRVLGNRFISEYCRLYFKKSTNFHPYHTQKDTCGCDYVFIDHTRYDTDALAMKAFYPHEEEKENVLYKDGNRNNRHYSNLMWSSEKELPSESEGFEILPGFSNYKFNKQGIGKSYYRKLPKILKPYRDEDGYFSFQLTNDQGEKKILKRNRIIATIFLPNPLNLPIVDHRNKKRWDDNVENLKWVTEKENSENVDRTTTIHNKPIAQFAKDGELLHIFKHAAEASAYIFLHEEIDILPRVLQTCAKENRHLNDLNDGNTRGGYIWRYVYEKSQYILQNGEVSKLMNGNFDDLIIDYPYYVTNFGNILNKAGFKLAFCLDKGYPRCSLKSKGSKTKNAKIHQYVALFFVQGRTKEKRWVNHKDGNRQNNHYTNLEWVTPSENTNHSKKVKPVNQFDLSGKFLRSFLSAREAANFLGNHIAKIGTIYLACGNSRDSNRAYGFIWSYADNSNIDEKVEVGDAEVKKKKYGIKVDQFNEKGEFIRTHDSASKAALFLGKPAHSRASISRCCNGISRTSFGFIWKFTE